MFQRCVIRTTTRRVPLRRQFSTYDWRRDHAIFNARCSEAADEHPSSKHTTAVSSHDLSVEAMSLLDLRVDEVPGIELQLATENESCDAVFFELLVGDGASGDAPLSMSLDEDGKGGAMVRVSGSLPSGGATLRGVIPEKFGVKIQSAATPIVLARLEGPLTIQAQGGSVKADKVSEGPVSIKSGGGAVECRVLNCDAQIATEGGDFSSQRMQGLDFVVCTGDGTVDVSAMYGNTIKVNHCTGTLCGANAIYWPLSSSANLDRLTGALSGTNRGWIHRCGKPKRCHRAAERHR